MSFEDELDADLDAQLATEPDYTTVTVLINKKPRKIRFTQMDGLAWAELCDRCEPRLDVQIDKAFGYNVRQALTLAAPISGRMQSGDEWVELSDERWKKIIRALPGAQVRAMGDALFNLNQWAPAMAVSDAKKASEVESAMKSFSPALSESPAAD